MISSSFTMLLVLLSGTSSLKIKMNWCLPKMMCVASQKPKLYRNQTLHGPWSFGIAGGCHIATTWSLASWNGRHHPCFSLEFVAPSSTHFSLKIAPPCGFWPSKLSEFFVHGYSWMTGYSWITGLEALFPSLRAVVWTQVFAMSLRPSKDLRKETS